MCQFNIELCTVIAYYLNTYVFLIMIIYDYIFYAVLNKTILYFTV